MSQFAEIFKQAAQLNRQDSRRKGNLVELPADAQVLASGDIHGHRSNMLKIIDYAAIDQNPKRILVFQEIIHGPLDPASNKDRSVDLLMRAARLKLAHPDNVIFLLGNHDVAQLTGNEIAKEGRGVCKDFNDGVAYAFGEQAAEVMAAITEFLLSLPLAVKCPNEVFLSHSLPSPNRMSIAGCDVLNDTLYDEAQLKRGGAAYEWTWGRNQTPEQTSELAQKFGVDLFILGHRHSGSGYETIPPHIVSITSDNDHGCVIEFDCATKITLENLDHVLKPIVALPRSR